MKPFNQLTGTEKQVLIDQLNNTNDMQEFLLLLAHKFDMKNCKPGSITKKLLSSQMVNTVMPMINPKIK